MGRSQVKYRSTHGRGRGRGRGDGSGGRGSSSTRGRPSHLRNLGSNAFRFEEREAADEQEEENAADSGGRTQFFASERNHREQTGATPGEYFQSRVMKQWEEKDEAADDATVGVLDLEWIAVQLQFVPPEIRYRMDPKYCSDLPFEPQSEDSEEEAGNEGTSAGNPVIVESEAAQGDSELDFLLNLSASTSSNATPKLTVPVAAAAPTRTPAETEQLEDWLDDVLNM